MSRAAIKIKTIYKKTLCIEFIILAVGLLIIYSFLNAHAGHSFLLGSISVYIPQIVFTVYGIRKNLFFNPKLNLMRLYLAEGLKFGLTIVLITLALLLYVVQPLFLFSGFVLGIVINSILPAYFMGKQA